MLFWCNVDMYGMVYALQKNATKRYNSEVETPCPHRHIEYDDREEENSAIILNEILKDEKKYILESIAKLFAVGNQPLSFCHREERMLDFVRLLVKLGQNCFPPLVIDIK